MVVADGETNLAIVVKRSGQTEAGRCRNRDGSDVTWGEGQWMMMPGDQHRLEKHSEDRKTRGYAARRQRAMRRPALRGECHQTVDFCPLWQRLQMEFGKPLAL